MSNFQDFHNMVSEFMTEWGFTATFIHTASTTPNDLTGRATSEVVEIPVQAIRMELIRPMEGSGNKTGTLIQDGDLVMYVRPTEQVDKFAEALSVKTSTDRFKIKGVTWKVVTVKQYDPSASDCVLYEFYIRK